MDKDLKDERSGRVLAAISLEAEERGYQDFFSETGLKLFNVECTNHIVER